MKLEVGMYVRSKNQGIFIISHINTSFDDSDFKKVCLCQNEKVSFTNIDTIKELKSSHNIIDLIEVGDYVNGYKVSFKGDDYQPFVQCDYPVEEGSTNHYRFYEKAIYSIVTKEQFESMSYKVC